ncbi:MAG: hypothetical protein ACFE89_10590 [Candidatus Hodarchaeota archaeon]
MAIHSFYVIAWDSGHPLYHRTWVEIAEHPTLLAGLIASVELLALKLTKQHVNVVTLRDYRFFFKVDEENGLLMVFITDFVADPTRFSDYLDMLHSRFIETFDNPSSHIPIDQRDPRRAKVFDELVDSLVSHWETGEVTLRAAQVMDILDVFTQFYNITLQRVLTERTREMYLSDIQRIFSIHLQADPALRPMKLNDQGMVIYDQLDPAQVNRDTIIDILSIVLKELISLVRRTRRRQSYETLFFEHYAPLIKEEYGRLEEYGLMKKLVMELL